MFLNPRTYILKFVSMMENVEVDTVPVKVTNNRFGLLTEVVIENVIVTLLILPTQAAFNAVTNDDIVVKFRSAKTTV